MKHTTRKLLGLDSSYSMIGWFHDKPFSPEKGRGTWEEFSLWTSSTPGKVDVAYMVTEGQAGLRDVFPLAEGVKAIEVFSFMISRLVPLVSQNKTRTV